MTRLAEQKVGDEPWDVWADQMRRLASANGLNGVQRTALEMWASACDVASALATALEALSGEEWKP